MINIKLLIAILDEGYDKKLNNILNKFSIKMKTVSNANGTASPSLLDYFGLVETKKDVFICTVPDFLVMDILESITVEFNLNQEGTGIAFIIPIASSNKFLSDSFSKVAGGENKTMKQIEKKYYLVVTIVLEGYLEQVISAAKKGGSSGGTVINGRQLANKGTAKIIGFNIEPEREIILSIVDDKTKNEVMREITKAVGIKTKAKGVCLALPVENAIGLASDIL